MACPGCATVDAGGTMPTPLRNLQVVTSAFSGVLLLVGFDAVFMSVNLVEKEADILDTNFDTRFQKLEKLLLI